MRLMSRKRKKRCNRSPHHRLVANSPPVRPESLTDCAPRLIWNALRNNLSASSAAHAVSAVSRHIIGALRNERWVIRPWASLLMQAPLENSPQRLAICCWCRDSHEPPAGKHICLSTWLRFWSLSSISHIQHKLAAWLMGWSGACMDVWWADGWMDGCERENWRVRERQVDMRRR